VSYEFATPSLDPGGELRLALYWQTDARLEQNYTVFIHILDDSGDVIAQRDSMPQDNNYATSHWLAGPLIDDIHVIPLPPDLPAGEYRAAIGLYVWQTGERLTVRLPDGKEIPGTTLVLDQTFEVNN